MKKMVRSLREKRAIVVEAFSVPQNVKATARKYGIEPSNIRRWKKTIADYEAEDMSSKTSAEIMRQLKKRTRHTGAASTLGGEAIEF